MTLLFTPKDDTKRPASFYRSGSLSSFTSSSNTSRGSHSQQTSSDEDTRSRRKTQFWRLLFHKPMLSATSRTTVGYNKGEEHPSYTPSLRKYGELQRGTIGSGSTAVVRLACLQDSGEKGHVKVHAIKRFKYRFQEGNRTQEMKRLISEFCIAHPMRHRNIIKTFDLVLDSKGRYCLVMEYCPDGDLFSVIDSGRMTPAQCDDYFCQLMQGLAYMHKLGVAHRDLKPENLLLSGNVLKIADFGVADVFREAWQERGRLTDGVCGSTPFIAPEVFLREGYHADRADIWSAAIVYICMRFGGVFFHAAERSDRKYRKFLRQYDDQCHTALNSLEPASCRTTIYAMINPKARDRPSAKEIVRTSWLLSTIRFDKTFSV